MHELLPGCFDGDADALCVTLSNKSPVVFVDLEATDKTLTRKIHQYRSNLFTSSSINIFKKFRNSCTDVNGSFVLRILIHFRYKYVG